jgi:ferrochelatase
MVNKAFLIVNTGTPDKPRKKEVGRFLYEFLNDRRVIDLPWVLQKLLVNLVIIPFRLSKSTRLYQRLWTGNGSPLLIYLLSLTNKLQHKLKGKYQVYSAMRYGTPSLSVILDKIKKKNVSEIVVFPLYPQYASSTTGSVIEGVLNEIKKWLVIPAVRIIDQFYNHPSFIRAFTDQIASCNPSRYDHIIFSYHGLPDSHLNKVHPSVPVSVCACEKGMPEHGMHCYKATCYETTRLLARSLNLPEEKYSVGFQSRLSKNWLCPFTDEIIIKLAAKGTKKILVAAPSFVADCLETIVEIEGEYREIFMEKGGEELKLAASLNDSDPWVNSIIEIADL